MGSKLSTGHRVNTNTNAFTNCDALYDTAAELYGINRETIPGLFKLKSEITANTELPVWLQVQLRSTMNTLHAMVVLSCKLHQARAVVLLILKHGCDGGAETLEKLRDLETMRSVLDDFKLVCHQHEQLTTVLDDLRRRKHDLDHNKLGRIKAWRKAWNTSIWMAKLGVTVLSVVFPVAGVRATATAANNGAGGVIGLLQPLVDSHLAGQQSSCEDERDLTAKILDEACFIFHRVNSARVLVELFEDQMRGLLSRYGEFLAVAGEDEDGAVSMAMERIKGKAGELVDSMESLEKTVDCSCVDLRRAALTLLQTVTDQVGISS